MTVGSLSLLFGVHLNHAQFARAFAALHALRSMASTVTTAISDMAHGLVDMAIKAAHAGTHLQGLSAGLGLTVRSVQEWSYVAQQAGTNADAFARGLGMFERNLRSFIAGRGSNGFREGMREIGISVADAKQMLAGPDGMNAALFKVSDHYERLGVTAHRAALNQQLFGARNREIAHDLGRGSALLRQQIEHLREIGGVLTDDQADNLKKFDNAINDIKITFTTLIQSVVGDLGPQFVAFLHEVSAWFVANREVIGDVIKGLFGALMLVFRALFAMVRLFVAAMNGDVGAIAVVSLLTAAFVALAYVLGTIVIPLFVKFFVLAGIGLLPFIKILLIVAAVIAVVMLAITHWSEIMDFLRENWMTLLAVILPFIGIPLLVIKHWDSVKSFFVGFGSFLLSLLVGIGEGIVGFFEMLGDVVVDTLTGLANLFLAPLEFAINKAIALINMIPGVDLGSVSLTLGDAASPRRPTLSQPGLDPAIAGSSDVDGQPGSTHASRGGTPGKAAFGRSTSQSVSIGATTINIHGVKDAQEAKGHIADHIDNQYRQANAGLAGE